MQHLVDRQNIAQRAIDTNVATLQGLNIDLPLFPTLERVQHQLVQASAPNFTSPSIATPLDVETQRLEWTANVLVAFIGAHVAATVKAQVIADLANQPPPARPD